MFILSTIQISLLNAFFRKQYYVILTREYFEIKITLHIHGKEKLKQRNIIYVNLTFERFIFSRTLEYISHFDIITIYIQDH